MTPLVQEKPNRIVIALGKYNSPEEYHAALEKAGIKSSFSAHKIINQHEFPKPQRNVELEIITARKLGIDRKAPYRNICNAAEKQKGLVQSTITSIEALWNAGYQPPEKIWLHAAIKPIKDPEDNESYILSLTFNGVEPRIISTLVGDKYEISPDQPFLFEKTIRLKY